MGTSEEQLCPPSNSSIALKLDGGICGWTRGGSMHMLEDQLNRPIPPTWSIAISV